MATNHRAHAHHGKPTNLSTFIELRPPFMPTTLPPWMPIALLGSTHPAGGRLCYWVLGTRVIHTTSAVHLAGHGHGANQLARSAGPGSISWPWLDQLALATTSA